MAKFKAKNIEVDDASSESELNIKGSTLDHEAMKQAAEAANTGSSEFEAEENIKVGDAHEKKTVNIEDSKVLNKWIIVILALIAAAAGILGAIKYLV